MRQHKFGVIVFLVSRMRNLLALGVNHTARDIMTKFAGVRSLLPHYVGLVLLSLVRLQSNICCTACHESLLLILWRRLEMLVWLTSCAKGDLCNLWQLSNLQLAKWTMLTLTLISWKWNDYYFNFVQNFMVAYETSNQNNWPNKANNHASYDSVCHY